MHAASRSAIAALAVVGALGTWVIVGAGQAQPPQSPGPLPLEPLGVRGEALYAAFEGWGPTKDGKEVLLFGYYNRNQDQVLDIPIGPNNMIEPAGPDVGQPTHFLTRRQYGLFAIEVPKDFGNKRYTWTLNANGQKTQVTGWKNPPYWIDFYQNTANGNETPVMRFTEDGPALQGPVVGWSQSLNAKANEPLALNVWVTDKPSNEPEGRGAQPPATTTADAGRGARGADRGSRCSRWAWSGGRWWRRRWWWRPRQRAARRRHDPVAQVPRSGRGQVLGRAVAAVQQAGCEARDARDDAGDIRAAGRVRGGRDRERSVGARRRWRPVLLDERPDPSDGKVVRTFRSASNSADLSTSARI